MEEHCGLKVANQHASPTHLGLNRQPPCVLCEPSKELDGHLFLLAVQGEQVVIKSSARKENTGKSCRHVELCGVMVNILALVFMLHYTEVNIFILNVFPTHLKIICIRLLILLGARGSPPTSTESCK